MSTKTFRPDGASEGSPGYAERSGERVEVVRELTDIDVIDVGPMFRIRFADGVETDAFSDELED